VADAEWFAIGLVIGVLIGIPLGWIFFQMYSGRFVTQMPASVVFDRDEAGRITAIHYMPGAKSG
jgi:hypothetical protein